MIETLLTMPLTGTAVTLLWLAVCRLAGEGIGIGWKYRGLRWSMLFWLVPIGKLWKALNKAAFSGGAAAAAPMITEGPVAVWRPAAAPLEVVELGKEIPSVPVSDKTYVKENTVTDTTKEETPTVETVPEPVSSTDSAETPETKQPAAPAACPHAWGLPLYDREGNVIGTYEIGCGGHMDFGGMTVEEAKTALAEG